MTDYTIIFYSIDKVLPEEIIQSLGETFQVINIDSFDSLTASSRHIDALVMPARADSISASELIPRIRGLYQQSPTPLPILVVSKPEHDLTMLLQIPLVDYIITPCSAKEIELRIISLNHRCQERAALIGSVDVLEKEKMIMLDELDRQRKHTQELIAGDLLFDKITGFPTTPALIEKIRQILERGQSIDIVYFSISKLKKVEEVFGWQTIDHVIEFIAAQLNDIAERTLTQQDILAIDRAAGDDFILFISSPESFHRRQEMPLRTFGEKIVEKLRDAVTEQFGTELAFHFDFYLGISSLTFNAKIRLERLVYNAIKEAVSFAVNQEQRMLKANIATLDSIIERGMIVTLYQPIVNLETCDILGFEAISRGLSDGFYKQPQLLFDLADQSDNIWKLERVCRRQAIENAAHLPDNTKLFINLDPIAAKDPDLQRHDFFEHSKLSPQRIVFEITERSNIDNFIWFKKLIRSLKELGYQIAIDDAGSGYSSLQSITELEPHFIKFDMTLVRGIDTAFIKQSLVEVLVKFAEKLHIPVIAEGIETIAEFDTLRQLRVPFGQGYLFSKPYTRFEQGITAVQEFKKLSG